MSSPAESYPQGWRSDPIYFLYRDANMLSKHGDHGGRNMPMAYDYPTAEERAVILSEIKEPYDRLVREPERKRITSLSRTSAYKMELEGRFPARRALTAEHCA